MPVSPQPPAFRREPSLLPGSLQGGQGDVQVTPLILDPMALHKFEPDEGTRQHLDTHVHGPLALFVGQLLPHKRPDLLVEALHVVATYLIPEAHLVLLGPRRIPVFAAAVQRQIVELGLANAWIVGSVTPGQLRTYYERADVLVTASDHEGFCVLLLEAISFVVPIVVQLRRTPTRGVSEIYFNKYENPPR